MSAAYYETHDWTGRKAIVAALLDAAFALPQAGGTVGPLPDGTTVIEVEHVKWDYLREHALAAGQSIVRDINDGGAPAIAAYNAAHTV